MKIIIHVQAEKEERFAQLSQDDDFNLLQLPSVHLAVNQNVIVHNISRILNQKGLQPTEQGIDFLNLALAVYFSDQVTSRERWGHLGWSRYFEIFLPVYEPEKWEHSKPFIENMLIFLSGDKWIVNFRKRNAISERFKREKINIEAVTLFSGGLDSYCGAIDILNEKSSIALIGHHRTGPNELSAQKSLSNCLKEKFCSKHINEFWFHVQPMHQSDLGSEDTQRARSILFIGLGVLIANSISDSIPLNVPENGLISLNIPLTMSRIGSFSTRTTHPYFFIILNKVLNEIGIYNQVTNPYKYLTKGEMLAKSENLTFLKNTANFSVSCAHPGHHRRWTLKSKRKDGIEIPLHCGNCTPCIIRRAAMYKAGIDDPNEYVFDIIKSNSNVSNDLRAFQIALERFKRENNSLIFRILQSGPIPAEKSELDSYKKVYINGMKEIDNFFAQK